MSSIDGPDHWRAVDASVWAALRATFLGSDEPDPDTVRRVLVRDYQPDSFTISERLDGPAWLDPAERDADGWLRGLVARRLPSRHLPRPYRDAAVRHVAGEVRRVLDLPVGDLTVAETLWNQEMPYLIDRIIGWCLCGDATRSFDITDGFNRRGRRFLHQFLGWHSRHLLRLSTPGLARVAVAAGLLGLDEKGGPLRCQPISLRTSMDGVWRRLSGYVAATPAVDHSAAVLDAVSTGPVRLVWWLDDLIETAFDLVLIQRLITINKRLQVTIVAKTGRHDNDAEISDVRRMVWTPALEGLRKALRCGRVKLAAHGPRMATANPLRLHPSLIDAIAACDLMVCKGGRIHEMFSGNIAAPMFTAYVVVRPFTEAQAGVDAAAAPLMIFGAEPGEWPWFGFRGRADRVLTLPSGRTVPACHTTVAEHHHHAHHRDPLTSTGDLIRLVTSWPVLRERYRAAARAEIKLLHDRIAPQHDALPPTLHSVLHHAHTIVTTGDTIHAG